MNPSDLTRRKAIFALSATALSATALSAALCPLALPARAAQTEGAIHILKDPGCGCCTAWATILDRAGFQVTTEPVAGTALMRMKADHGIPAALASCHTALIDGYAIEGHVPVVSARDAPERGAVLSLRAGRHHDQLVARDGAGHQT